MRCYLSSLIIIFALTVIPSTGLAQQSDILVSVPPFAPFAKFDEDSACAGTNEILLNLIFNPLNQPFKLIQYPYARILHSLRTGDLDLALIFKNQDINKNVEYIGPISKSKVVIVSMNNHIDSYEALYQLNAIAVIRNAHFEAKFDSDKTLKKSSVESYKQGLTLMRLGRVDAVVGSYTGLEYAMHQLNFDHKIILNAYTLGEKEWWLHLSKHSNKQYLSSMLSKRVTALYQDDLIHQIYLSQVQHCIKGK